MEATATKSVFLLEDHEFLRTGLRAIISQDPQFEICGEYGQARGAVQEVLRQEPDIVILDITFPDGNGLEITKGLRAANYEGAILVLTMHDEKLYADRMIRAGADGYVMKSMSSELFLEALHTVAEGEAFLSDRTMKRMMKQSYGRNRNRDAVENLTDRQLQVLELIGSGLRTQDIGGRLNISSKTVDAHRARIKEILGISDMGELIRFAVIRFGGENL